MNVIELGKESVKSACNGEPRKIEFQFRNDDVLLGIQVERQLVLFQGVVSASHFVEKQNAAFLRIDSAESFVAIQIDAS